MRKMEKRLNVFEPLFHSSFNNYDNIKLPSHAATVSNTLLIFGLANANNSFTVSVIG